MKALKYVLVLLFFSSIYINLKAQSKCINAYDDTWAIGTTCTMWIGAGKTEEADLPIPLPSCQLGSWTNVGVWVKLTIPATGNLVMETDNSGQIFDLAMAVYSGTCGSLTEIACDGGSSPYSANMPAVTLVGRTPGEVIYIYFWEEYNSGGTDHSDFTFCYWDGLGLPVEMITMSAECCDKGRILTWATASETNNNYFEIQRSVDGINWDKVAEVDGAGNSNQQINYNYIDEDLMFVPLYYRLKQIDYNGKFELFDILSVESCSQSNLNVTNNGDSKLSISINSKGNDILHVCLYNLIGEKLSENALSIQKGNNMFSIDTEHKGLLIIRLFSDKGIAYTQKIFIN